MPLARVIEAELLDQLPGDDARALRSRADLLRINAVMMQAGIMARAIRAHAPEALSFLDLGAGDGAFMCRVIRQLGPPAAAITLVDRQSIVSGQTRDAFRAAGYEVQQIAADALDYLDDAPCYDVICINLFLHHLREAQLRRLLAAASQKCRLLVACEPRRGAWPMLASRMLWMLGCNDVTRHDARVSVRAGFSGAELSALWPAAAGWRLSERPARLFTHLFVAQREACR
ncbi:MAG: methyltransferase domain-containing protein [Pseudolabrys sp.]|nr:methyltransferase domain-containing protein [Pseudolabrys sp.]MBV9954558.1 methyltransferase domain-containing protein [Pseudolabrys sp.]